MILRTLLIFFLLIGSAEATCHIYLVPTTGTGTFTDQFRPNYVGSKYSTVMYGSEGTHLVAADVDDATDATISALSDVIKIPDNLDQTIGAGALAKIQTVLENKKIPSGWLTAGTTYRQALRVIINFFRFISRFRAISGITAPLFSGAVTLNTTFGSLSAPVRGFLSATAASFNLDTTGVTGATTIRVLLKGMADQFADVPINMWCKTI